MLKQNISLLLIVIVATRIYLPHAKSLRIAEKSLSNVYPHEDARWNRTSSCLSPDGDQLDFFNRLYNNSDSIGLFSGNIMYYSLKALEAERESKEFTAASAEENQLIANITDQSRLIPANMDLANKVVCARILQELDAEAESILMTPLCGWDYVCHYKADRFPNYLFKARCLSSRCNINCGQGQHTRNLCQTYGIRVTVLEMKGNCEEWHWNREFLPTACICTKIETIN